MFFFFIFGVAVRITMAIAIISNHTNANICSHNITCTVAHQCIRTVLKIYQDRHCINPFETSFTIRYRNNDRICWPATVCVRRTSIYFSICRLQTLAQYRRTIYIIIIKRMRKNDFGFYNQSFRFNIITVHHAICC